MLSKAGKNVDFATSPEISVSPGVKGAKRDEEFPKIKKEPLEEAPLLTSADDAREELENEEDDDYVVDEDGVEYYQDESFRIKQVPKPLIVNRTMKDLYSKCQRYCLYHLFVY